jgi:sec-independent protein translocase protein TatC
MLTVATGLTTPEKLGKARPYVFLGAFVVGMLLTPPDIISQTVLAVPVYLLYEVGIIMSKIFKPRAVK